MYFEIYQEPAGGLFANALTIGPRDWRWRLRSANHKTLASGEGYRNRADCEHAVDLLKQTTRMTPVRTV